MGYKKKDESDASKEEKDWDKQKEKPKSIY